MGVERFISFVNERISDPWRLEGVEESFYLAHEAMDEYLKNKKEVLDKLDNKYVIKCKTRDGIALAYHEEI